MPAHKTVKTKSLMGGGARAIHGLIVSALVDGTPRTVHASGIHHTIERRGNTRKELSTTASVMLLEAIAELEAGGGKVEITAISTPQTIYDDIVKRKRASRFSAEVSMLKGVDRLDLIPFEKRNTTDAGSAEGAYWRGRENA